MKKQIHKRATIGVLAGWQLYDRDIHGFLRLAYSGIHSAAQERGCNLLLACGIGHSGGPGHIHPAWPIVSEGADFVPVGPWNTDGLLVISPLNQPTLEHIQQVMAEGHPVVFIGPNQTGTRVVSDNRSGIFQAVEHLAGHGCRRIAFLAGHEGEFDIDSFERLQAYQAAVREYGLASDPNLILYGKHDFTVGRDAIKQFLGAGIPFDAILASNDTSAIGAIHSIREAGLHIPEDLAIVGFDDWPDATGQDPPLTTVHYPVVESSRKAMDLLLEMIDGRPQKDEIIKMPVKLIVRESCGCSPIHVVASTLPASKIANEIVETVRSEIFFLNPDEIRTLCKQLVDTLALSILKRDPAPFRFTFQGMIKHLERIGDDPHVWHSALSLLERNARQLAEGWDESADQCLTEMILQGRVSISASTRRQYRQYAYYVNYTADQVGALTMSLFTATSEKKIHEALFECLPVLGIHHGGVAFFEPEGEDVVAVSRAFLISEPAGELLHFPSRQFPPVEMFADVNEKPTTIALFPLIINDITEGYVAFETFNLETCIPIVRQLGVSFRSVRLHEEAVEGRKLAEEADYIKSRFLSTVSHELRTPLNLIVGLSNLVLQDDSPEAAPLSASRREDLEQIHRNAEHLGRLIRDVLDLATSQAGQLRLQMEQLDLMETLKAALEAGEELARQKGLEWKVSLPETRPMVMGDRTRLRQVLLNLISNAVKFTEHGLIEVKIETGGAEALVSVRDTGLGILPKEQEIIFDEFRQSERTTARGYGGMGLGLAISRRLVELHGGKIGVQSSGQEGSGSTFHFTIPILHPQEEELPAPDQERFVALLVAERSTDGKQLENHLASQGFPVRTFRAEQTAWLKQVLAASPAAVVLDASLAPKRGWEIMRELKANPSTHDVPVLFYSLAQSGGSILELDYLTKPVDSPELVRTLARQGLDERAFSEGSKTILIVDDEPGILEMHARVVRSQYPSCNILRAHNGREALESIQQERPDLVLLDLMMPELDGFGVLKAMRSGEHTRDIPVIVLTAQALTEEDMTRLNQGVAAVLQKGIFNAEETLNHVGAVLARSPRLGSDMQRMVRRAMAYIQGHYAEPVSRNSLAHYLGVSERYLTRCFHDEMGITPSEYLNRYRMKQAKLMLEAGKSVTDTALEIGFSSVSYFTRYFQKEMGMSPRDYRRSLPKNK